MSGADAAAPDGSVASASTGESAETARRGKGTLLAWVGGVVLTLDLITKAWVVRGMTLYESIPVFGDVVRLTYTHNPGAAFGINVGEHSRIVFLCLALVALGILLWLYWTTPSDRRFRLTTLALVAGGAVGNIVDRIRYERGVVDFLDVGLGTVRWPVFNVADMAVSIGAVLLFVSFYREDHDGDEPGG